MITKGKVKPTILDVAQLAGVSKSTVSRVISGEFHLVSEATREKVEAAIRQLNYEYNALARGMRTRKTNMVLLAIPDITNPFWVEVARGAQDFFNQRGYAILFANSDWQGDRETNYLRLARRSGVDGILINPILVAEEELKSLGIPIVVLGIRQGYEVFDQVGSDTPSAIRMALNYLVSQNHRRIGLLLGRNPMHPRPSRLEIYITFLNEHNLPFDEELVVEVPFEREGGYQGALRLLSLRNRPTAILASNDLIAIGAMQAVIECGLSVPNDVSIIGIDDIYAASLTMPSLTTVAKPKREIGKRAAEFLLERIEENPYLPPRKCVLPCNLVIRGSVVPVN